MEQGPPPPQYQEQDTFPYQRSKIFSLTNGANKLEVIELLLVTPSMDPACEEEAPPPVGSLALGGNGLFLPMAARAVRLALSFLSLVASSC